MKGVERMEFEVVEVKAPKCLFPNDVELVFLESQEDKLEGDCLLAVVRHPSSPLKDNFVCLLVARRKLLKPAWKPPKLKKGWLTWDETCGGSWWWWPEKPVHTKEFGWVDASTGDGGDCQEIGEVMAEFLGCPDCTGFDERNCIWEVGE